MSQGSSKVGLSLGLNERKGFQSETMGKHGNGFLHLIYLDGKACMTERHSRGQD